MKIQSHLKLSGLAIAMTWLILLICVNIPYAATIYVAAGYKGDEDGSAAKPFNTLEEGLKAAKSGDIIQVAEGTYEEVNIEISNMDELTLQGAGADKSIIILTDGQFILSISNVKDGKIDGFTLNGQGADGIGIQLTSSSLKITNNKFEGGAVGVSCWRGTPTISNNEFVSNGAGIKLETTDNAIISDNTISQSDGEGISLDAQAKATITDNKVDGYHYQGIYCGGGSEATIRNNEITGTGESGIYIEKALIVAEENTVTLNKYYGINGKASDNIVIQGNTIAENGSSGIKLETSTATIDGNEIRNNGGGIEIDNSPDVIIRNNDILENYDVGIGCNRANLTIENNTISGNKKKGILCSSSEVKIANNVIALNAQDGVSIQAGSAATITDNQIIENSGMGINISTTGVVNIIDNEIQKNMEHGIYKEGAYSTATIQNNTITENRGDGIANYDGEAKIRCNFITNNWGPGIGTGWDATARPNAGTESDPGNNAIYGNRDYQLKNNSPNDISAIGNYWGAGTGQNGPKVEKEIYNDQEGSVLVEPWLSEPPTECAYQPPEVEGGKYRSSILLPKGVNLISLPLKPDKKYTAETLADELGATIVIKSEDGKFIVYVPDVELGVDFPLEEGKGYIINLLTQKNFTLTGTPWGEPLAPADAEAENTWAFAVVGDVTPNYLGGEQFLVNVTNLRTGVRKVAPADRKGRFAAVFVDMNRNSVVKNGDELEIIVTNGTRRLLKRRSITAAHVEKAYIEISLPSQPAQSELLQNYPNPFNPETWLPYQLADDAPVVISIYNAKGQLIRILNIGLQPAGFYLTRDKAARWDGRDNFGDKVASGVYFYSLRAGKFRTTRRMVILK